MGVAHAAALGVALASGWALRGRSPILVAALADVAATLVIFVFSVRHDNSSLYDPYWSVAPIPIAPYWASLVSIHLMPTAWVFLGLLPTWPALASQERPVGALDVVALAVAAGAIAVEAISDFQLRRFLRTRRDSSAVLDTGLWRFSRHPNYFGEVAFWWGLWLFGRAADPGWAWTVVGTISITLLFALVSTPWMDRRMLSRHPGWAAQMAATSALVPWPRRSP